MGAGEDLDAPEVAPRAERPVPDDALDAVVAEPAHAVELLGPGQVRAPGIADGARQCRSFQERPPSGSRLAS